MVSLFSDVDVPNHLFHHLTALSPSSPQSTRRISLHAAPRQHSLARGTAGPCRKNQVRRRNKTSYLELEERPVFQLRHALDSVFRRDFIGYTDVTTWPRLQRQLPIGYVPDLILHVRPMAWTFWYKLTQVMVQLGHDRGRFP